jgi:hypothetical protein
MPGEALDDRADRDTLIVAVQHPQIDVVGLLALQRLVEVAGDVFRCHAARLVAFRVSALAEDDDGIADTAVLDPGTEGTLVGAVAVAVRGVEGPATGGVDAVEQREGFLDRIFLERNRALDEARDRFVDALEASVFHRHVRV